MSKRHRPTSPVFPNTSEDKNTVQITDPPSTPITFVDEIQRDLANIKKTSENYDEYYRNTMIYFARKQAIFLYDIRHWLKELVDMQNIGDSAHH